MSERIVFPNEPTRDTLVPVVGVHAEANIELDYECEDDCMTCGGEGWKECENDCGQEDDCGCLFAKPHIATCWSCGGTGTAKDQQIW